MFSLILTIIYLVLVGAIGIFVGWHGFKTDKIYEKITAAIMLIILILRLFLIK